MIISQSRVSMQSDHEQLSIVQKEESLRGWVDSDDGGRRVEVSGEVNETSFEHIVDKVRLSAQSLDLAHGRMDAKRLHEDSLMDDLVLMKKSKKCADGKCRSEDKDNDDIDALIMGDSRLHLMKQLVETLTGKKVRVIDPEKLASTNGVEAPRSSKPSANESSPEANASATEREGWGVAYDLRETHIETEQTSFTAQGVVKTNDGKQIAFEAAVQMERENVRVSSFQLRAGDALIDPLVLNFDGNAAELSEDKMSFDLNSDGVDEQVSYVVDGSGFLVLDNNKDGIVNNGTELFGPNTGNGFAELAQHDDDGNGWIDEADAVYDDLRIWSGSTDTHLLSTLRSKNVGAIYLGNVSTPFENRDAAGNLQAQTVATGVFLHETGQVGTVQQIDLVG